MADWEVEARKMHGAASSRRLRACRLTAIAAIAMGALTFAERAEAQYVPYTPTPQPLVDRMLELADVKEGDFLIDLGCGDGRILVTAAKRYGARGLGVDIDAQRLVEANALAPPFVAGAGAKPDGTAAVPSSAMTEKTGRRPERAVAQLRRSALGGKRVISREVREWRSATLPPGPGLRH